MEKDNRWRKINMNFALIGVAGFVAPRHLEAIYKTNNKLVAALDPHDSVGVLDSYFPNCEFFTEFERFDRHLEKLRRGGNKIDYISICSPNYLHDAHCRLALRLGADAICEKPLVLNPCNLDQLEEIEKETGKRIYTVLQLRLHPELIKLKKSIAGDDHKVQIKYVTPRGAWYNSSWKGNIEKSGGLLTNIGIHLFDLMIWLFGKELRSFMSVKECDKVAGLSTLERASVHWSLSIDKNDLPDGRESSYRLITIDKHPIKFDNVFTDLHTNVYEDILSGGGFGISDVRPSIELVYKLRGE